MSENALGGPESFNRLSWLRSSSAFLNAVIASPQTRWLLFNSGQPLVASRPNDTKRELAYLSTKDVRPFLGTTPFFGQGRAPGSLLEASEENHFTEAARHLTSPVVFLGLKESSASTNALPSSDFANASAAVENLEGTPYFSLDVAELSLDDAQLDVILKDTDLAKDGQVLSWSEPRIILSALDTLHGGICAVARSMVDWNQRNKFCPGCGSLNYSMWGGWKLSCTSLLPWADNTGRKPCPTTKGLHNFTHPRTDAVVIMIAIDETNEKILLGRNRKFPGNFYSALAGFIEPGESFEDAVEREMWEEAGVKVWNIKYHSGQPWPYPASLMVGFFCRADASKPVRVDLDNELVDAKWYTRSEILAILRHPTGTRFGAREYKKMSDSTEGRDNENPTALSALESKPDDPPFKVPPTTAIAGVLIRDWAEGKIGFPPGRSGANL